MVTNHQREERLQDKLAQAALLEAVEKEESTTDLGELRRMKFCCLVLNYSITLRKELFRGGWKSSRDMSHDVISANRRCM